MARCLERDGYKCRKCGRGGRLEVHHTVPVQDGGGDDLDLLLTLVQGVVT